MDNRIAVIARQAGFFGRDGAGRKNSETDGFAMEELAVIAGPFNRVTDRMTKIEQRARAGSIKLIFGDDVGFYLDIAANERLKLAKIDMFKRVEHFRVGNDRVLDDFSEALIEFTARQRFEKIDIVNHERRMMNCADQIFPGARVHAGFSANRAVHHGEQRGRNLHVRNSTMENRRDESRNIADHPAAKPDDERLSIQ